MWTLRPAVLPPSSLPLLLLLSAGCRHSVDQDAIRQAEQEKQYLSDSARIYWDGLRWGDTEKISAFIEDEEDRALFRSRMEDRHKKERLVDVEVLRVKLITTTEAELAGTVLPPGAVFLGDVRVRTEGYSLPAQILRTEEHQQDWYRTTAGWWVAWDPDAEDPPVTAP